MTEIDCLIVEDSATQALVLQELLTNNNFRTEIARDGREALQLLKSLRPMIVISDVLMPNMDGYTLCSTIKNDPELRNIRVLLLTTLSETHDIFRALQCGADNFVTKPAEPQQLLARVHYLLANSRLREEEGLQAGLEVTFGGVRQFITSSRLQILNLLLGTYDLAVQKNKALLRTSEELKHLAEELERRVEARTAHLQLEINQRKQVEEALRQSEKRFRELAENVEEVFYSYDLHANRMLYVSPAYEKLWGRSCKSLYENPNSYLEAIHPEDRRIVEQGREHHLAGTSTQFEYRIVQPDGCIRWVYDSTSPVIDEQGRVSVIVGTAKDVTSRKLAEEEKHKLANRLTTTLESITDGFYTLDRDWRFTYVNKEAEKMLERSRADLLGENIWQTFVDLTGSSFEREYFRAVAENKTVTFEEYYAPLDMSLEVRAYPTDDGLAVYFQDITQQKRAQADQEKLESQLRQAQKMEAVGRLAGGVAHDFNNMLGVILGNVELAMEQVQDSDPLHSDLVQIQEAANRSADLTRQLLAFARKQTIMPKVLDLNQTIENMLRMLERLIGEEITLMWKPLQGTWPIKMDPAQVDQVLVNLVVNARDAFAGSPGNIIIETCNATLDEEFCKAHAGLVPGAYAMLTVSDSGLGMDKETAAQLFEPFFTTKKIGEGTGLGLATVYGIVKQNEGHINVYSEPGQGAVFKIYLPAILDRELTVRETTKPTGVSSGEETILLVEDEAALLDLANRILTRLGYIVLTAETPEAAISTCTQYEGKIDLLVTDLVLPEMSGNELWRRLCEIRPNLPCLFVSGYTANVAAHHGVLEEKMHFLQKPFSMAALAQKIREALGS